MNAPLRQATINVFPNSLKFHNYALSNKELIMAKKSQPKKKYKTVTGILVECKSGRYLAFYEHRSDIIANGDTKAEVKKTLKKMYAIVIEYEKEELGKTGEEISKHLELPSSFTTRQFTDKIPTT